MSEPRRGIQKLLKSHFNCLPPSCALSSVSTLCVGRNWILFLKYLTSSPGLSLSRTNNMIIQMIRDKRTHSKGGRVKIPFLPNNLGKKSKTTGSRHAYCYKMRVFYLQHKIFKNFPYKLSIQISPPFFCCFKASASLPLKINSDTLKISLGILVTKWLSFNDVISGWSNNCYIFNLTWILNYVQWGLEYETHLVFQGYCKLSLWF